MEQKNKRLARLQLMLEKYTEEERKRRLEGRIREADTLQLAILRTEAAILDAS